MTFDLLDNTFIKHAASSVSSTASNDLPDSENTTMSPVAEVFGAASLVVANGVLARLLTTSPGQWWALSDHVFEAWRSGVRSIAVAGHCPREGRSTLIHGLELMLPHLGCPVRSYESSARWWQELVGDTERCQWHQCQSQKRADLVLVDAGIWFPPGRLRLRQLQLASFGFDAVIVVRRQDGVSCAGYEMALAETGVSVLGEVVCFASAATVKVA